MSYGRIFGAFILAPSRFLTGPPQKFAKQMFVGKRRKSAFITAVLQARLHDEQQDFRRSDPDRARTDDPQRDRLVL